MEIAGSGVDKLDLELSRDRETITAAFGKEVCLLRPDLTVYKHHKLPVVVEAASLRCDGKRFIVKPAVYLLPHLRWIAARAPNR